MSWVLLSMLSALFLGVYDLAKKAGLRDNAVPPVLFISVLAGALVWLPFLCWSTWSPESYPWEAFKVQSMTWFDHGLIICKASLVSISWVFNYFAVKHLPVSVSAPIRATAPLWTILIAVGVMGERPAFQQWLGVGIILLGFYAFSFVGRLEGIHFHRNRWVGSMIVATIIGSLSALYDKYLLQIRGMEVATVQCWFSLYLVVVLSPFLLLWRLGKFGQSRFEWRWCIPMVGILLLVADFFYFQAVGQFDALISVISPLRRCAVLITFIGGVLAFKEKNFLPKLICVLILLLGAALLKWNS
jgi:bacterial/archaeal transporter family protein